MKSFLVVLKSKGLDESISSSHFRVDVTEDCVLFVAVVNDVDATVRSSVLHVIKAGLGGVVVSNNGKGIVSAYCLLIVIINLVTSSRNSTVHTESPAGAAGIAVTAWNKKASSR